MQGIGGFPTQRVMASSCTVIVEYVTMHNTLLRDNYKGQCAYAGDTSVG